MKESVKGELVLEYCLQQFPQCEIAVRGYPDQKDFQCEGYLPLEIEKGCVRKEYGVEVTVIWRGTLVRVNVDECYRVHLY